VEGVDKKEDSWNTLAWQRDAWQRDRVVRGLLGKAVASLRIKSGHFMATAY